MGYRHHAGIDGPKQPRAIHHPTGFHPRKNAMVCGCKLGVFIHWGIRPLFTFSFQGEHKGRLWSKGFPVVFEAYATLRPDRPYRTIRSHGLFTWISSTIALTIPSRSLSNVSSQNIIPPNCLSRAYRVFARTDRKSSPVAYRAASALYQ